MLFSQAKQITRLVGHNHRNGRATQQALPIERSAIEIHLEKSPVIFGRARQPCTTGKERFRTFDRVVRIIEGHGIASPKPIVWLLHGDET